LKKLKMSQSPQAREVSPGAGDLKQEKSRHSRSRSSRKNEATDRSPVRSRSPSRERRRSSSAPRGGGRRGRSRSRDNSRGRRRGGGGGGRYSRSRSRGRRGGRSPNRPACGGRKCFVGNLEPLTDEIDLEERFSAYGALEDIYVPRDRSDRANRGYGFITFVDRRDAEDACREDGEELRGRRIGVNLAKPRPGGERQPRTYVPSRDGIQGSLREFTGRGRTRSRSRSRGRGRRSYRSRSRSAYRSRSRSR